MDPCTKRRKIMFDSLEDLVKEARNEELKSILQRNNPSDLIDNYGMTLLHLAAKYNKVDLIHFLLESNYYNVDARNSSGATPLYIAAKNYSYDTVKILLEANANIFATNAAELTILDVLLMAEKTFVPSAEVFEYFLRAMKRSDANVDTMAEVFVNAHCNLEIVVSLGDARVTEAVLQRMPTIDPIQSRSALYLAMNSLDLDNIHVLLTRGPDRDARMALFFGGILEMIQDCNVDLNAFEIFVRAIIDWDIISKDKLDYFHNIIINGSQNIVRVLLECDVNVHVKNKFGVDLIAGVFSNKNIDAIELLKNRKFNENAQGFRGYSALHFALRSQSTQNVQFLIDRGANLNIADDMGKTPILDCHAWNNGRQCLGQLLLHNGADIQAFDYAGVGVYNLANVKYLHSIVIPHLAILKAQNTILHVNFELLINSNNFADTYELCCRQLRALEECKLTGSLVLFDVLTRRVERLAAELRDVDFTMVIGHYCLSNRIITYYSAMLETKLQRAMMIYRAMRNMALIVSAYTEYPVDYDHLVIERIFSFLPYWDVCSLA